MGKISEAETFELRTQLDLSNDIKTKEGGKKKETGEIIYLSYLSWASGHKVMKLIDSDSQVIEHEFDHHSVISGQHQDFLVTESKPYRQVGDGYMVKVSVVLFGKVETENFPVTNYRNQPVVKPSPTDINNALKRAFVKALAKHGIALYLYEGEDLPEPIKIDPKQLEISEKLLASLNEKTGTDNLKSIVATINKYTENDPRYGKKIKTLAEMTYDQQAIFKIAVNKLTDDFEKQNKK